MAIALNRRNLISGTAAALAGAAAVQATSNTSVAQADEAPFDYTADVVIVGSGMGGMSAGVQALLDGAQSAIIVEISSWTGGGTAWAYGAIHAGSAGKTLEEFDTFTQYEATSDLSHKEILDFEPYLHWVQDDLQLPVDVNYDLDTPFGRMLNADGEGNPSAPRYFFDAFVDKFEQLGGQIMTETRATRLLTDENRTIVGLQCSTKDGSIIKIGTPCVILACGGFQNDSELKNRYFGVEGAQTACMGTPYNTGAGIKMASEVGASLQGDMSQWAGCFVASQPAKNWMEDVEAYEANGFNEEVGGKWWLYETVIDNLENRNIWVNSDGLRFVDETLPGLSSKHAVSRQRRSAAIIVMDAPAWNDWMATPAAASLVGTVGDQMQIITSDAVGGAYFQADSIEELADQLNAAGPATYKVHKANLVKTIAEYNAAAEAGAGADLFPAKSAAYSCTPIAEPPFYALPIQACAYAPYGGLAIDENAQVLDLSRKPIDGLYATVPCAGGVFHEFYAGTIAAAGITGRWAGHAAAEAAKNRQ